MDKCAKEEFDKDTDSFGIAEFPVLRSLEFMGIWALSKSESDSDSLESELESLPLPLSLELSDRTPTSGAT